MTKVTLDTNVFTAELLIARAKRVGVTATTTTVSRREVEGSFLEDEVHALEQVPEALVLDESRLDEAVLGSSLDEERLELALGILSNGAFPAPGKRENLSCGQRRQLRDAMVLCAHISSNGDIFVSNDARAYINHDRREALEAAFGCQIMTVEEFQANLSERESHP